MVIGKFSVFCSWQKTTEPAPLGRIKADCLDHILTLVHDRNIEDPEDLNDYKPWTAEVIISSCGHFFCRWQRSVLAFCCFFPFRSTVKRRLHLRRRCLMSWSSATAISSWIWAVVRKDFYRSMINQSINQSINKLKWTWTNRSINRSINGSNSYDIERAIRRETRRYCDCFSGVGRVVMQVAALFQCKKSVGIELMETRANFAKVLCDGCKLVRFERQWPLISITLFFPATFVFCRRWMWSFARSCRGWAKNTGITR